MPDHTAHALAEHPRRDQPGRARGEADPDHVKAIDTYWICTAEHGLNASTFAARVTAWSTGASMRLAGLLGKYRALHGRRTSG